MEWVEFAGQLVVVLGFFGGAFSYVVLRPLNRSIEDLRDLINEMKADLRQSRVDQYEMGVKLAEVEQRARSAHHRLDELTDFCRATHGNTFPIGGGDHNE